MEIDELRRAYREGRIDTKRYGSAMFEEYEKLFLYQILLRCSKVSEIIINEKDILFKIKQTSVSGKSYEIVMAIYKEDSAAVPITILSLGEYEQPELDMVSRIMRYFERGTIFDIGANLGWYTLNIKKQYPKTKIYAFEPISETFEKMQQNYIRNGMLDIRSFNLGLYKENTILNFYYDVTASGASSMKNLREQDTTRLVQSKVRKLDDIVTENNITHLDFIKCDVEGAEMFVYEGGKESIHRFKPVIFSEMLRKWSRKFGYHPNDIIIFLESMGYQCFVLSKMGQLRRFMRVSEKTTETNYFFFHTEKHKKLIENLMDEKA